MAQRLGDGEVGVGQVDVLADDADGDFPGRVVHALEYPVPLRPVDVAEGQVEVADDEHVEATVVEDLRDVVDARGVDAGHDSFGLHVAGAGDLRADRIRQGAVGAEHDRIGLDADGAQRRHRVLGRLRLQLSGGPEVGHEGDVDEEHVVPADVVTDLAGRLEEGLGFDIADGAADLGDDDIGTVRLGAFGLGTHARLDLIGDVRDDLDGVAEVRAAAFLRDDRGVDLSGGHVRCAVEAVVEEALVVADVEVGLCTVLGDEDFTVLEGVHRAGIHVEVGIQLLHGHGEAALSEQVAEARCRQTLAQRGGDASRDEDVLCRMCAAWASSIHHGI